MAKPSKPDKGTQRNTDKPKPADHTQPLPHLRKIVDEYFTNWPTEDDNKRSGGK